MHITHAKHAYIARLADGTLKQPFQEFPRQCSYYSESFLSLCAKTHEKHYYYYYNYYYYYYYYYFSRSLTLTANSHY